MIHSVPFLIPFNFSETAVRELELPLTLLGKLDLDGNISSASPLTLENSYNISTNYSNSQSFQSKSHVNIPEFVGGLNNMVLSNEFTSQCSPRCMTITANPGEETSQNQGMRVEHDHSISNSQSRLKSIYKFFLEPYYV